MERSLSYLLHTKDLRSPVYVMYDCIDSVHQVEMAMFTHSDFRLAVRSHSRSGVWLGIDGCPTCWSSKMQTKVADPTTAEETVAT